MGIKFKSLLVVASFGLCVGFYPSSAHPRTDTGPEVNEKKSDLGTTIYTAPCSASTFDIYIDCYGSAWRQDPEYAMYTFVNRQLIPAYLSKPEGFAIDKRVKYAAYKNIKTIPPVTNKVLHINPGLRGC